MRQRERSIGPESDVFTTVTAVVYYELPIHYVVNHLIFTVQYLCPVRSTLIDQFDFLCELLLG